MKTPNITAKHLAHPKYRADIDGLRAVAVLAVVCFHAFPNVLKGGFVGVDIFFIISGFLISTILLISLKKGAFSFKEFYLRRILRIFPALIVVLSACYIIGWLVLLPTEFQQLGKHIVGGAGFASNLLFWQEVGYFDNLAETKPLLHLWSLGVEEQYYIVWPCLLLLAWKQRMNVLKMAAFFIAVSFFVNMYTVHTDAAQAFYSPISRFWELLLGGSLAYLKLHQIHVEQRVRNGINRLLSKFTSHSLPKLNSSILRNSLSILGAFLIISAVIFVDKNKFFPGWWALLPSLGAYLIISVGPRAVFNRLVLSSRPMVWVGLISYPLYLWHWPLLSFARIVDSEVPRRNIRIGAVILSVVLAWITYRLVERPIRFGKHSRTKTAVLVVLMSIVGIVGYGTYAMDGLEFRFPKIIQELTQKHDYTKDYVKGTCFLNPDQDYKAFEKCEREFSSGRQTIVLWGDSHASHLYPGYKARFGDKFNVLPRTASTCPPILDIEIGGQYVHCKEINSRTFALIKEMHPDRVVLEADWTNYNLSKLGETVARLKELEIRSIDLVGPVPRWDEEGLPKLLYRYYNKSLRHEIPYRMSFGLDPLFFQVDEELREKVLSMGINYISPKEILCDANGCITRLGETSNTLISFDRGHLTKAGSEFLVSKFPKY